MSNSFADYEQFQGAVVTTDLVGRQDVMDQVFSAIQSAEDGPQFIFLTGKGGIGKTRILLAVLEAAHQQFGNLYASDHLVDLYDIPTHSPDGLMETIRVSSGFRNMFLRYEKEREELELMRSAGGGLGVEQQFEEMSCAFLDEISQLSRKRRVVLAFDTSERLVYFQDNKGDSGIASSWQWLMDHLNDLGNTSLLLAGRPECQPLINDLQRRDNVPQLQIPIQPFNKEDSLAYFDAVIQVCEKNGASRMANRVRTLTQEQRMVAHEISGGQPILLALLVDHLALDNLSGVPNAIEKTLGDLSLLPEEEKHQLHQDFEAQLITRVVHNGRMGDVIQMMGRAPKGIDAILLANLLELSQLEAEQALDEVSRLSFVKIRRNGRYFLHDEMYDLLKRHIYDKPHDANAAYTALEIIRNYYKEHQRLDSQELSQLFEDVESGKRAKPDREKVLETYSRRRAMMVELVYYRLQSSAASGFKYYYRYMREALNTRDSILLTTLQAELASLLNLQDKNKSLPYTQADSDLFRQELLLFEVNHLWINRQYDQLIKESDHLLSRTDLLHHPLVIQGLKVMQARARVFIGGHEHMTQAATDLNTIIDQLDEVRISVLRKGEPLTLVEWYQLAVLALAYRARAYQKRVLGDLQESLSDYQRSSPLWRHVNIDVELGGTLNDMGFVLSELGEWEDARGVVLDALDIRQRLGPRAPVALSLNTLGIIMMRTGNYDEAIQFSERALALMRSASDWRGMGLALTAIAEAQRRRASTSRIATPDYRVQQLREARDSAREALRIVEEKTKEKLRQVEALIEAGCATREMIRVRMSFPSARDNVDLLIRESEETLRQAVELAKELSLFRYVDALVNLAWLGYYAKRDNLIQETLQTAQLAVPDSYYLQPQGGLPSLTDTQSQILLWVQLGKLEILQGHRIMDRVQALTGGASKEWDANEEKIIEYLREACLHYAKGMEYDHLYSKSHPGIQQAKIQIYERFKRLPPIGIRIVTQQVQEFEKEFVIKDSAMRQFLMQRALWYQI